MDNIEIIIFAAVFAVCIVYVGIRGRRERKARILALINSTSYS